ncbi:hypothetical protein ACKKBG_A21415 [Auxenochlorella protothecoides x Auxenochlorella symbiontica]
MGQSERQGSPGGSRRRSSVGVPSRLGPAAQARRTQGLPIKGWKRHGSIIAAVLAIGLALGHRFFWHERPVSKWPNLVPFPSPKLLDLQQFKGSHAEKYLWGTYRPGYYLGMRPRHPTSLVTGLMWVDFTRSDWFTSIRHEALQSDDLGFYGWLEHDGENYGIQQLEDRRFNMTTSLVKRQCKSCGAGGDWALRVNAKPAQGSMADGAPRPVVSLFFYVAAEGMEAMTLGANAWKGAIGPDVEEPQPVLSGTSAPFGKWALHVRGEGAGGFPTGVHWLGLRTPYTANLTSAVKAGLRRSLFDQRRAGAEQFVLRLPDDAEPGSNVYVLQVQAWLPASLDLVFTSGRGAGERARVAALTGAAFNAQLARHSAAFNARLARTFPVEEGRGGVPTGTRVVSKAALSQLLGGMGYWFGHSIVWVVGNWPPVLPNWDAGIFTASPSRSQFPRGFLWDEGFHQLLIRRWNPALSRDVLAHWLDLMASTGWIAREQILGDEARLRVPKEFVPQPTKTANPPSLFLVLSEMAAGLESGGPEAEADRAFLEVAWPRLLAWYTWLNTTQAGPVPGSFRWRQRDNATTTELNPRTLASGLDDYPRASHPSRDERHLDLRCWMTLSARTMVQIGTALGLGRGGALTSLQADAARLSDFGELTALHYDAAAGRFADWGLHSEDVALAPDPASGELVRQTASPPRLQWVPHHGYVSLFPLIMRLIPPHSSHLGRELDALTDPGGLLSPAGIRSLSQRSSLYSKHNTQHDPPYWRGTVWININYLVLDALRFYARTPGPYSQHAGTAAAQLRAAVLDAGVGQFRETGFFWEQYNDTSSAGRGAHPFTGWTALLTLIAAEA